MTTNLIKYGSEEYTEMVALRTRILREPLGLSFSNEDLLKEKNDLLCGYYDNNKLIGCCILSPIDSDIVQLRQMAITSDYQGKGIGNLLLQFAESISVKKKFKKIILHARKVAESFYLKAGYKTIGEEFIEVGISHIEMEKQIEFK